MAERSATGRPSPGEEVSHDVVVTRDMLAILLGRTVHPVYGTAWMVRHAEEAGRLLVERHLTPEEDATGYRIDITHLRPARVGQRLTVTARCTFADEDQCVCEVEIHGPAGPVGRGTFVQRYIEKGALGS